MIAQLLVIAGVLLFASMRQGTTPSFGAGSFRFSFSTLPSVSTSIQRFRRARREMIGSGASTRGSRTLPHLRHRGQTLPVATMARGERPAFFTHDT